MSRFKLLMFLGWILGPELARMETKKHSVVVALLDSFGLLARQKRMGAAAYFRM